jgi:hypothetical protein
LLLVQNVFFAPVNEIKALLAHIVATYDIKLRKGKSFRATFSSLEWVFPGMRTWCSGYGRSEAKVTAEENEI